MNPPKNFKEKLDRSGDIYFDGKVYGTSVSPSNQNVYHVWLHSRIPTKNALCVKIYWDRMHYSVEVAIDGDGMNFHTTATNQGILFTKEVQTLENFREFLMYVIEIFGYHFNK